MKRQTKTRRSHAAPTTSVKTLEKQKPVWTSWLLYAVVVSLIALPFAYGKYFEFNSPGAFDSGAFVYSAKRVVDGAKIGTEEQVSARAGTLLVNMLGVWLFGFSETGPKLIQMILQLASLTMMFFAMRRLYGMGAATLGTFFASLYLSAPLMAKFGNVKEQYMIAFMVIGVSCYCFRQVKGGWWWALLSGAFLAWSPSFKQTGVSAIGAVGLFVLLLPVMRAQSWQRSLRDIGLLVAGAALSLTPIYIWMMTANVPFEYWPYGKIFRVVFPGEGPRVSTYLSKGRALVDMAEVSQRIFRWYGALILPIVLALASILCGLCRLIYRNVLKKDASSSASNARFIVLFALWWTLDMAFVWISPRSYEQYFLPLTASAAMCSGLIVSWYCGRLSFAKSKAPWVLLGVAGMVTMIVLSQHIVFGVKKSPHSGAEYRDRAGNPEARRGYVQKYREVTARKNNKSAAPWEQLSLLIKNNTRPDDKIFVWGWVPGIYVHAQRMSAASYPFTSEMHVRSPEALGEMIKGILADFAREQPKYIVDCRKQHFPWNRPALELWTHQPRSEVFPELHRQLQGPLKRWRWQRGYLDPSTPLDQRDQYDEFYCQFLEVHMRGFEQAGRGKADPDELDRYRAMRPFRDYLMAHYRLAGSFGNEVLFELDPAKADRESL